MFKRIIAIFTCLVLSCSVFSSCKSSGKITVTDFNGEVLFEVSSFDYEKWQKSAGEKFSFIKNTLEEAVLIVSEKNGSDKKSAQDFLIGKDCKIATLFNADCFEAARSAYIKNLEDSAEFGLVLTDTSGAVLATYNNTLTGEDNPSTYKSPYSTIKPLSVYAPAIEAKVINWASMFEDSEYKKIKGQDGALYSWPTNASNKYSGKDVAVAYGIKQSLNTVAVKCLKAYGVKKSIGFLRSKLGMALDDESRKAEIYGEEEIIGNIAMGYLSTGVSMLDMVGYYGMFVNGGEYQPAHFVNNISVGSGEELFRWEEKRSKVLSPATASIMNRMLFAAVSLGATGEKAAVDGLEVCGKTGTGNDNAGNWFVGFSPNYVCAVWHGAQMGKNVSPQVFSSLFSAIPQEQLRFERFEGVAQAAYCTDSGKLLSEGCRNMEVGYFTPDNIPEKCDIHS